MHSVTNRGECGRCGVVTGSGLSMLFASSIALCVCVCVGRGGGGGGGGGASHWFRTINAGSIVLCACLCIDNSIYGVCVCACKGSSSCCTTVVVLGTTPAEAASFPGSPSIA